MSRLVSIGIPTYNGSQHLDRAIASVLAQTYGELELVISDNASTDDTAEVCARAAARDSRVRVLRQPRNRGPTANFNAVLAELHGKHAMLIGDDDVLAPTFVECCRASFVAEPGLALVHGRTRWVDCDDEVFGAEHDLTSVDAGRRVLGYLGSIHDNSVFYGLMRGDAMKAAMPLPNVVAGDVCWVARLAFQGGVRARHDTMITRSFGGTSASHEQIVAVLGLSARAARRPAASMIANVHRDISSDGDVYAALGGYRRRLLAARAAATLTWAYAPALGWEEILPVLARPAVARTFGPARDAFRRVRPKPPPPHIPHRTDPRPRP